jgi:hypothetical protein
MPITGRPTLYSQQLADEICDWIASGKSLRSFCAQDGKPTMQCVMAWLFKDKHPGFIDQYARAREAQAEVHADEINDIADDAMNDVIVTEDGIVKNHELVQRSKLRIDARMWIASRLLPKKYGNKVEISDTTPSKRMVLIVKDGDIPEAKGDDTD